MGILVCFGDSITARKEGSPFPILTSKLEQQLTNWKIINAGVSGNNTYDALKRIDSDVIIHNPDLVTILFGANDAAFHKMVQLEEFGQNLLNMVIKIGSERVILISPAPVNEELQKSRTNEVLMNYSKEVERVATITNSYYIDLFTLMINKPDYPSMLINERNDGLHFGKYGYEFLSHTISDKIKQLKKGNCTNPC